MQSKVVARLTGMAKGVAQSSLSLSFNLVGILAGAIIAINYDLTKTVPWALLLYPGILSMRGSIGGLYAGRLSTALHVGTIRPRFLDNTADARLLLESTAVLTLMSSVIMSVAASIFSFFLLKMDLNEVFRITLVVIATMSASLVLMAPLTLAVSVFAHKSNLDPDVIIYPIISTTADVIVTVTFILILKIITFPSYWILLSLLDLAFIFITGLIIRKNFHEKEFVKTIKEFTITLFMVSLIVNITGSLLESLTYKIGNTPELYAVYPAVIDTVGDVGSIVGSTASTKIMLGLVSPSISEIRQHAKEASNAWSASLLMFGMYSLTSSMLFNLQNMSILFLQLFLTNVVIMPIIMLISLIIASLTASRGWDPDNFIIPIESALSDGLTTLTILLVVSIF